MINIKNQKDIITIDLRTKQIRYVKENKKIEFIDLNNDDIIGYDYLFNNDKNIFLKTLISDIKDFLNKDININKLVVV